MISISEISRLDEKRKRLRKQTYVKLHEQISKKIRQSVELGQKYVFVQIPFVCNGISTLRQDESNTLFD